MSDEEVKCAWDTDEYREKQAQEELRRQISDLFSKRHEYYNKWRTTNLASVKSGCVDKIREIEQKLSDLKVTFTRCEVC